MPSNRTRLALIDIRDNGRLAQNFIEGLSFDAFKEDRRTFCAMTRALEIVSEAVRHLPPAVRGRHPELPRRAIIGVGKSTAAITIMSQKNLFGALCNKAFPRCWRD